MLKLVTESIFLIFTQSWRGGGGGGVLSTGVSDREVQRHLRSFGVTNFCSTSDLLGGIILVYFLEFLSWEDWTF